MFGGDVLLWLLQHTNIVLFLLIERLFIYHEYPRRLSSISALIGFAVIYQLWLVCFCSSDFAFSEIDLYFFTPFYIVLSYEANVDDCIQWVNKSGKKSIWH